MSAMKLVCFVLLGALFAPAAHAAPIFSVTPGGLSGGNRQWNVTISPDASLFGGSPPGGSIAVEMAFSISPGSLLSIVKNATNFPSDIPGTAIAGYPTGPGVQMSGNKAVAFLGSDFFTTATPKQFVTIATAGSGLTTLNWLGAYSGKGRIAQAGQNFDLYSGSVSVPEPASCVLATLGLIAAGAIGLRRGLA
jgi:hypothetical protein